MGENAQHKLARDFDLKISNFVGRGKGEEAAVGRRGADSLIKYLLGRDPR